MTGVGYDSEKSGSSDGEQRGRWWELAEEKVLGKFVD